METACHLYEFRIVDPAEGLVDVLGSTDERIRAGKMVRLEQSTLVDKKVIVMHRWICKGFRLVIYGPNGPVHTAAVSSILIQGDNWSYSL